ncbi:MAG: hypothetical protein GKR90_17760 [Pseudomonadales bacterium]|nr:hypothetical protein [Pseudomonadales bacterium]
MDPQSALTTVAEVGIGIAGFSTIAAAFASQAQFAQRIVVWVKLRTLLVTSAAVVFFSFLPMIMFRTGLEEATNWTICSSVYIAWIVGVRVSLFFDTDFESADYVTSRFYGSVGMVSLLFHAYNVVAGATDWPYLAALVTGLFIASFHFFLLIRDLVRGSDPTNPEEKKDA